MVFVSSPLCCISIFPFPSHPGSDFRLQCQDGVPDFADDSAGGGVDTGATKRFAFRVLSSLQDDDEKYLRIRRSKCGPLTLFGGSLSI